MAEKTRRTVLFRRVASDNRRGAVCVNRGPSASDGTRLDVLLLDRDSRPVVVQYKQDHPTLENLDQLRHYMKLLVQETGCKEARGILVHGGARKLRRDIAEAAQATPAVEIVQYRRPEP